MPLFRPKRASLRASLAAFPLLLLPLLSGCGGGSSSSSLPTGTGDLISQPGWTVYTPTKALTQKKWTFLVYLNAANNLEPDGDLNVNQMEKAGSTSDVNIVIQWKRDGGAYNPSGGNWADARRYYINKDSDTSTVHSPLISETNADMGSASTLQAFVQWGVAAFPAQHYCLVLWDHGAGWRSRAITKNATAPAASSSLTRGLSYDDITGNHIDTTELGSAIDISSTGRKWDTVFIDCSLMQMAEVAYEIRNQTTYILGSEESPPGTGLPYDTMLSQLITTPSMTPLAFSTQTCQDTYNTYHGDLADDPEQDTTQSVLDATQLAALPTAVDSLGSALFAAKSTWGTQISTARLNTENYGHGYPYYEDYKDLQDFLDQLTKTQTSGNPLVNDAGVLSAVSSVRTALSNLIVFNVNDTGHPRSHGLSIFLPSPADYAYVNNQQSTGNGLSYITYPDLSFAKATPNWVNFLQNGPS